MLDRKQLLVTLDGSPRLMQWARVETASSRVSPSSMLLAWAGARQLEQAHPVPDLGDAMLLAHLLDPVKNRFRNDGFNIIPNHPTTYPEALENTIRNYLANPVRFVPRLWSEGSELVFSLCYTWVHGDLANPSLFASILYPPHYCMYCADVLHDAGLERRKHYELHQWLEHSPRYCSDCGGVSHTSRFRRPAHTMLCPMGSSVLGSRIDAIMDRETIEVTSYVPSAQHTCAPDPAKNLSHRCVTCGVHLVRSSPVPSEAVST